MRLLLPTVLVATWLVLLLTGTSLGGVVHLLLLAALALDAAGRLGTPSTP